MKRMNDEAVSPVIGVILMVAITVVLAAVVFVLVTNLSNTNELPPDITWRYDTDGTLQVISADTGTNWNDLSIAGCTGATPTGNVTAGQKLTGCSEPITITHTPTNTLIYER